MGVSYTLINGGLGPMIYTQPPNSVAVLEFVGAMAIPSLVLAVSSDDDPTNCLPMKVIQTDADTDEIQVNFLILDPGSRIRVAFELFTRGLHRLRM